MLFKLNAIWKRGSLEPGAGSVHVSMNDYLIHRLRDVPRVAWEGLRLRRRWPDTEGALGLCSRRRDPRRRRSGRSWRLGIGPGKTFDFKELPLEHKLEVGVGMKEGDRKIDEYLRTGEKIVNGWKIGSWFGDRDFFHGNWLLRAGGAKAGIYGNDAVEATYPMTKTLADGTPLDASKVNYTLTFPAGQMPPVNAFWSVTMYDGKTQLLVENPLNRYLINSPMLPNLKTNADGSLTLHIQKGSPGQEKESNWLPAPNGPVYLVMRLYWPKAESPSILPPGSGTWSPPAAVVAN
jgi:hypothetical protein